MNQFYVMDVHDSMVLYASLSRVIIFEKYLNLDVTKYSTLAVLPRTEKNIIPSSFRKYFMYSQPFFYTLRFNHPHLKHTVHAPNILILPSPISKGIPVGTLHGLEEKRAQKLHSRTSMVFSCYCGYMAIVEYRFRYFP